MARVRPLSEHARTLLLSLASSGREWRHGYDLARSTGLKSGTLYPLLIRLEGQGYLEAEWQPPAGPGRPPRHAYRLTDQGMRFARDAVPAQAHAVPSGGPRKVQA